MSRIGQFLNPWNRCNPWLPSCFVIFLPPNFLRLLHVLRGRIGISCEFRYLPRTVGFVQLRRQLQNLFGVEDDVV